MKRRIIFIGILMLLFAMLVSCNSAKSVKISFDAQGGSKCKAITVDKEKESIELPETTRPNYSFTGWYADEDLIEKIPNPLPADKYPTEDVTYYAGWDEILYNVFFFVGEAPIFSKSFSYGETLSASDYPSLDDYPGYEWKYESFSVTESVNVMAEKKEVEQGETQVEIYIARYVVSGKNYRLYNIEEGKEMILPPEPTPATGYYFVGWSTSEGGQATELPSVMPSSDVVYYALFRAVPDSTDYLVYREGTDGVIITGLTAEGKYQQELGIPAQIGGKNVVAIGYADEGTRKLSDLTAIRSTALTTVYLPKGLKRIGSWAFAGCSALDKVVFRGTALSYIGYGAFAGCTSLESFGLTDAVTMVDDFAFSGLNTTGGTKLPEKIKEKLPAIWQSEDWYCTDMALSSFEMTAESTLSSLGSYCFYMCKDLENVRLSTKMDKIDYLTFFDSGLVGLQFYSQGTTGEKFKAIDGVVYSSNEKILYYYPVCGASTFVVPDGVVNIYENAFRGNEQLTDVTLSQKVTTIGENCFRGCINLAYVGFEEGSELTTISRGAFADCPLLSSMNLPSRVTNLAEEIFENDSSLATIVFSGSNVTGIGARAFYLCLSLTSIILPSRVSAIGDYAFYGCSSLVTLGFSDINTTSLVYIGDYAFCDCSKLESVSLPSGLKFIGDYAFFGKSKKMNLKLENVRLEALECLGMYAFSNTSITSFTLQGRFVTKENALRLYNKNYTIGEGVFKDCTLLKNFSFNPSDAYNAVPREFLYGCTYLESITFTYNIEEIGDYALYGCTSLKKVSFNKKTETNTQMIRKIGNYSFSNCTKLLSGENVDEKSRILPVSLTTLGEGAFKGCVSISAITIPENLEVISKEAFFGCTSLTYISYDNLENNRLHTLGEKCFAGCTALGTGDMDENGLSDPVSLPVNLKQRAEGGFVKNPFYGCTSLIAFDFPGGNVNGLVVSDGVVYTDSNKTDIYAFPTAKQSEEVPIPNTVTVIEDYAFYGATLTKLTFVENDPENDRVMVTLLRIGAYAFAESALKTVELAARVSFVGDHAFENCNLDTLKIEIDYYETGSEYGGKTYYISGASNNAITFGQYAFYHNISLADVQIASRVTEIGEGAFASCYKLSSIVFLEAPQISNSLTLGGSVFAGDTALRKISFPGRLVRLGEYALNNCYNLESVFFSEGTNALEIDGYALSGNHFVFEITLPANIVSLGEGIFSDDTRLKYVYFPEELTKTSTLTIPKNAFLGDSMLDSLTVPDYITEIGEYAYYNTHLYEIKFEEGIYPLVIGRYAFAKAVNLTSVTLPRNTVVIDDYAFYGAAKMKSITYSGTYYECMLFESYSPGTNISKTLYNKNFYPATGSYRTGEKYYRAQRFLDFSNGSPINEAVFRRDELKGIYVPATGNYNSVNNYYRFVLINDAVIGQECEADVYVCRYVKLEETHVQFLTGVQYYEFLESSLESHTGEYYVDYQDGYLSYFELRIGEGAFSYTSLERGLIDGRVREMGKSVFEGVVTLTGAVIDGIFDTIPDGTFCNVITDETIEVYIGENITKVGNAAFRNSSVRMISCLSNTDSPIVPLTAIGDYAFYGSALTEIILAAGSNVLLGEDVSIGESAFENCRYLQEVAVFTAGDLTIGAFAFGNCEKLSALQLTSDRMTVGKGFAYGATSLYEGFAVEERGINNRANYILIDHALYTDDDYQTIVFYPAGRTGAFIELSAGVEGIGDYAFYGNRFLTGIMIRNSGVITLGENALAETSLTIYVSSTLVSGYKNEWGYSEVRAFSIGLYGFVLTIQNSGKYYVSAYLGEQEELTIPGTISPQGKTDVYEIIGIEKDAFRNNRYLRTVHISAGIKTISNSAFRGCTALETVYIGENVTGIKNYAFYGCTNLQNVVFAPNSSVVSIGNYALAGCSSLTHITLPSKLESIGSYAFSADTALEGVEMQEGLTEIKNNAFEGCTSLHHIIFPTTVNTIGNYILRNCNNLIYIRTLSEKVPKIEDGTFVGVPDGVFFFVPGRVLSQYNVDSRWRLYIEKLISADYIYDKSGETEYAAYVLAPIEANNYRLVAYIGDERDIVINSDIAEDVHITAIGENAFAAFVETMEIGYGVTVIEANAFTYAVNLRRIKLPATLEKIASYAFADLKKLNEVEISDVHYVAADQQAAAYNGEGEWEQNRSRFYQFDDGYVQATGGYSANNRYYFLVRRYYLTTIEDHAFYNCTALTSFVFPESLTSIGKYAFSCDEGKEMSLSDVTFNHNDINGELGYSIRLEDYAFANNTQLSKIVFNCYLSYMGEGVFKNCINMSALSLNSNKNKALTEVPSDVRELFKNCNKLNIIVPSGDYCTSYINAWKQLKYVPEYTEKFASASPPTDDKQRFVIGDYVYAYKERSKRTVVIVSYLGTETTVTFPIQIVISGTAYDVISIGRPMNNTGESGVNLSVIPNGVTSVTIRGSVEDIEKDAFRDCLGLEEVIVEGKGLRMIKEYAFAYCPSLEKISLPSSLETIGSYAFVGCARLNGYDPETEKGIYIQDTTITELIINSYAFFNCLGMETFRMPTQLKEIGDSAFEGCTAFRSIRYGNESYLDTGEVLGESYVKLKKIGRHAFHGTAISEIMLPETVETVEEYAFADCQKLLAVYLFREPGKNNYPDGTRSYESVFNGINTNNTKIYVPPTAIDTYKKMEAWDQKQVISRRFAGDYAYELIGGDSITLTAYRGTEKDLNIPDSIKIGDNTYFVTTIAAYFGTPELEKVVFSRSSHVYKIENYAFAGCTSLREIRLPGSDADSYLAATEVEIGKCAFLDCTSLVDVHLPQFITYLSAYVFQNCTSLEELTLPSTIGMSTGKDTIISGNGGIIGNGSFYNCVSLSRLRVQFVYESSISVSRYGSSVFQNAGSNVVGGLKIIVASGKLSEFSQAWSKGPGDKFTFCEETYLFGDYLMEDSSGGYELLQYRGDADEVSVDGDFAGKRIVSLDDELFLTDIIIKCGDFVLGVNTDDSGSFTLIEYEGEEDIDLSEITVLGRSITRIDGSFTAPEGVEVRQ